MVEKEWVPKRSDLSRSQSSYVSYLSCCVSASFTSLFLSLLHRLTSRPTPFQKWAWALPHVWPVEA